MEKVICVVGPTAVGKTKMGVELAKLLNGEVISADSVQVYKGLDIGSAKVTKEEMQGIIHHLIDIRMPNEQYDMVQFQKIGRELIKDITSRGKVPIVVGGTGLYVKSLIYDYDSSSPDRDTAFSNKYSDLNNDQLFDLLTKIDPEQAKILHKNNRRRVERAIEIFEATGKTKSNIIESQSKKPIFDVIFIGLKLNRDILKTRIDDRVDQMIESGLVQELKNIVNQYGKNISSINSIGYKELIPYLDQEKTLNECVEQIKIDTRQFAKKQMTWFNNQVDTKWFDVKLEDFNITINEVLKFLKANFIK